LIRKLSNGSKKGKGKMGMGGDLEAIDEELDEADS